jgi:hypothetical protein
LIRIDRLFQVDKCTRDVLWQAAMNNDTSVTGRLGRIESSRPTFGRRQACDFYFYCLALFELDPPLVRLRSAIDPEAEAFPKLYDFDKCFQRRRKEVADCRPELQSPHSGTTYQ